MKKYGYIFLGKLQRIKWGIHYLLLPSYLSLSARNNGWCGWKGGAAGLAREGPLKQSEVPCQLRCCLPHFTCLSICRPNSITAVPWVSEFRNTIAYRTTFEKGSPSRRCQFFLSARFVLILTVPNIVVGVKIGTGSKTWLDVCGNNRNPRMYRASEHFIREDFSKELNTIILFNLKLPSEEGRLWGDLKAKASVPRTSQWWPLEKCKLNSQSSDRTYMWVFLATD